MPDTDALAAQLEAEALANGWPRNHVRIDFFTPEGNPAMALVTVTVTAPNIVENNDTATTAANAPITIDVLANDSDPLGGTLVLASVQSPTAQGGTAVINADGRRVDYTPPVNFAGTDTFNYTAARA